MDSIPQDKPQVIVLYYNLNHIEDKHLQQLALAYSPEYRICRDEFLEGLHFVIAVRKPKATSDYYASGGYYIDPGSRANVSDFVKYAVMWEVFDTWVASGIRRQMLIQYLPELKRLGLIRKAHNAEGGYSIVEDANGERWTFIDNGEDFCKHVIAMSRGISE